MLRATESKMSAWGVEAVATASKDKCSKRLGATAAETVDWLTASMHGFLPASSAGIGRIRTWTLKWPSGVALDIICTVGVVLNKLAPTNTTKGPLASPTINQMTITGSNFGDVERLFSAMTDNNSSTAVSGNKDNDDRNSSTLDTNPRLPVSSSSSTSISFSEQQQKQHPTMVSNSYYRPPKDNSKEEQHHNYNRREESKRDYYRRRSRSPEHRRRSEHSPRRRDFSPRRKYSDRSPRRDYSPRRSESKSHKESRYAASSSSQRSQNDYGKFADRPKTPPLPPQLQAEPPRASAEEERVLRDRRTVLVSQVAAKVQSFDLERFFNENNCRVRHVRLVMDKGRVRHKGVAYVEFVEESVVRAATALTGTKLMGIPLVVQLTETEKNRLAQLQQNGGDKPRTAKLPTADLGLTCIQLDCVHHGADEFTLRQLLRPFGHLESVKIVTDFEGKPRGTAFCKYRDPLDAKEAVSRLQDYLLLGLRLKLALVKDSIARFQDGAAVEEDVNLTAQARTELMLKWARSKNILPANTSLVIRNLPTAAEQEQGYSLEADLRAELGRFGQVAELIVHSSGEAKVTFEDVEAAEGALNSLHNRFFAYKQLQVRWSQ